MGTEVTTPEDELEDDVESDKENVLPSGYGKRKENLLQSDNTKHSKSSERDSNAYQELDVSNNPLAEKINDSLTQDYTYSIDIFGTNNHENSRVSACNKLNGQSIENGLIIDTVSLETASSQGNQISQSNSSCTQAIIKNSSRRSRSLKREINEKKICRRSKTSPAAGSRNKKYVNKVIDEYFVVQPKCKEKHTNEENVNPNIPKSTPYANINKTLGQENVIFDGTVISSMGDTSIKVPLKPELLINELRLENVGMSDRSGIVRIANNSELFESEKPKTISSKQSKTVSLFPGAEAETIEADGTLIVQTSGKDINTTTSTEQLILIQVQLPTKENSLGLPNNAAALKRNRTISTTSSEYRLSEGKYAKISELMTKEQKRNIEIQYSIDMTLVDELRVGENVVILDKFKFQCKICKLIYSRLDKCQVRFNNSSKHIYSSLLSY